MRIAHVTDAIDLSRGGVVRAVIDLAELMAARGHEVAVLAFDTADAPEQWGAPGSPAAIELGPPAALGRFTADQRAAVEQRIASCDVLHLHALWHPFLHRAARTARGHGKPYVLSVHGMLDDWSMAQRSLKKRLFLALGARETLRRAHRVHCTARAELEQARGWFAPAEGVVIPLLFDLSPYRDLPGPELARERFADQIDERPAVLFLSRLHYKKGPDVFIRAIAELKSRGVSCQGLIAGSGESRYVDEMKNLTSSLGVGDDVRFLGMVSGELKTSLYQLADVFALPTSQENFGFVFPEALACQTPVVTTRGVDTHPELEATGGAIIAEPTPDAFADAISRLLSDPDTLTDMGERGRMRVFEWLDPDTLAREYEDMYAKAAGSDAPSAAPAAIAETGAAS